MISRASASLNVVKRALFFSWKREWKLILGLFLFFRLLYSTLGILEAAGPAPELIASGPAYEEVGYLLKNDPISQALVNVWFRWDTAWYLKVSASGYIPSDPMLPFQPLYPWLIHGPGVLVGNYLLAALIISNLACLIALLLFYEVALGELKDQSLALWATFLLVAFPTSFYLFAAYTESLFLVFALGTWLAARRRHWLFAGVLGGLATLTRLQGAILTPVLILVWLQDKTGFSLLHPATWRRGLVSLRTPVFLATLLPAITFASWNLVLRLANLGSITLELKKHFGISTVMPWTGFGLFLKRLAGGSFIFMDYIDLALLLVMMALLVVGLSRLNPALSLYNILNMTLYFMRGTPPHLLDSFCRYFLALFPVFILMAQLTSWNRSAPGKRILLALALFVSISLHFLLVMAFLDWRWVA